MAVLTYLLIWIASVTYARDDNGTRFLWKDCRDGQYACRLQFRGCGLAYFCKETDSCSGMKGCCPPRQTCCTGMREYCCPDGHSCNVGMCSSYSFGLDIDLGSGKSHISNIYKDTPSTENSDSEMTSSSGNIIQYTWTLLVFLFFCFIILFPVWLCRWLCCPTGRVEVPQRRRKCFACGRNVYRTAVDTVLNDTANSTLLNPLDNIRDSTNDAPVPNVQPIQSELSVELPPPPYWSLFIDNSATNKNHDSRTVQEV